MSYSKNIKLPNHNIVNCFKEMQEDRLEDKCRFVWRVIVDITNMNILFCESPFQFYNWNWNEPHIRATYLIKNWHSHISPYEFPNSTWIIIKPYFYSIAYDNTKELFWIEDFKQRELPFANDLFWVRASVSPQLEDFITNIYKECVESLLKGKNSLPDTSMSQENVAQIDYVQSQREAYERATQSQSTTSPSRQSSRRTMMMLYEEYEEYMREQTERLNFRFQMPNEYLEQESTGRLSQVQTTTQPMTQSSPHYLETNDEMNLPSSITERPQSERTRSTTYTLSPSMDDNSLSYRIEVATPSETGESSTSSTRTLHIPTPTISLNSLRRNASNHYQI